MDNGLEPTPDGYVLRPKRAAYRTANLVGLGLALVWAVSVVPVALPLFGMLSTASRYRPTLLAVIILTAIFGLLGFVAWFTSQPPILTVTRTLLTLIGGAHRRRDDRSHIVAVYRGLAPGKTSPDKSYFVVLTTIRAITIPVRHFDAAGLEEAMRRLNVPISGDFKQRTDEISVKGQFGRPVA